MLPRARASLFNGSKILITTYFSLTSSIKHNPFLSMSIEKLIKLASSKPCNSLGDLELCMFIFDSFSKSKVEVEGIRIQMNEEACRITRNISKFIGEMEPKGIDVITQNSFRSLSSSWMGLTSANLKWSQKFWQSTPAS